MGFPGRSAVKNQPAMQEMCWRRFDLWVGKIPRRRKWQPIPVILPRKSIDKGAWQTKVHRISNELEMTEQLKKKNNFLCQVLFVCFCFYHLSWACIFCDVCLVKSWCNSKMSSLNHWGRRPEARTLDYQRAPNPVEYQLVRALWKTTISTLKTRHHSKASKLQCWTPHAKSSAKQEHNLTH